MPRGRSRIASGAGCWPKPRPAGSRRWRPSSSSCSRRISRSRKSSRAGADCAATPTCCASTRPRTRRPPSGSSARSPRSRRRSSQHQQARAKQEQDNLRRLQQLCRQVETLAAAEQITLKAGDRALRDIRTALDERVPLPSKKDRQEIQARLEAARAALAPRVQELRDADEWQRWANLQVQEELCREMEALKAEENLEVAGRRMRELQARWKQVALAPRAQGEVDVAPLQDRAGRGVRAHVGALRRAERGARRQPRPQAGAVRARRGAGRFDRLGEDGDRDPGAAGRVEDDRSGRARTREGDLGAVPRRVRSLLHPPPGGPEAPQGRVGRPTSRGRKRSARRPRRWPIRPTGTARPRSSSSCRPSGRRSARSASRSPRRSGSASAPPAIGSSIATSTAIRSSCRRRPPSRHGHPRARGAGAGRRRAGEPRRPRVSTRSFSRREPAGSRRRSCRARCSRIWPRGITRRVGRLVATWPAAFAGTDLDPETTRKRMEKLLSRVEELVSEQPARAAQPVADRAARAAVARAARGQHDVGGGNARPRTRRSRWRAAEQEVRSAQAQWMRLGPVPPERRRPAQRAVPARLPAVLRFAPPRVVDGGSSDPPLRDHRV